MVVFHSEPVYATSENAIKEVFEKKRTKSAKYIQKSSANEMEKKSVKYFAKINSFCEENAFEKKI